MLLVTSKYSYQELGCNVDITEILAAICKHFQRSVIPWSATDPVPLALSDG